MFSFLLETSISGTEIGIYYILIILFTDILIDIVDFFNLRISISKVQLPTYYADNSNNTNLVIDLILL